MLGYIILYIYIALMLFLFIGSHLMIWTPESKVKKFTTLIKKHRPLILKQVNNAKEITINNARKTQTQINNAHTMIVNNYGKNSIKHLTKDKDNDALLDDLLSTYSSPLQSRRNDVDNRRNRVHNDVFIVKRDAILNLIGRGYSMSKIIRTIHGVTGGELWVMYSIAIKALAQQYGVSLRRPNREERKAAIIRDNINLSKNAVKVPKTVSSENTDKTKIKTFRSAVMQKIADNK